MSEARVFDRVEGRLHVRVPAADCPDCDPRLEASTARGREVVETECAAHERSVRLFSRRRSVTVTLRAGHAGMFTEDAHVTARVSSEMTHYSRDVWRLFDSPRAWGVDPDGPAEEVADGLWSALAWLLDGFGCRDAARWRAAGVPQRLRARAWLSQSFTPEEVGEWVAAGVTRMPSALVWRDAGVAPSEVPSGFEGWPTEWFFADVIGARGQLEWGQLWQVCSEGFARISHEQGRAPAEVRVLAEAYTQSRPEEAVVLRRGRIGPMQPTVLPWSRERANDAEEFADNLGGLDWDDAAVCIRAGLSLREMLPLLVNGEDLAPIWAMAALVARP